MSSTKAATPPSARPLCIWRLMDGKPGHESQTLGLVSALERLTTVQVHTISLAQQRIGFWHWLLKRFALGASLPAPDLIIGAGHRTHWALLAARRAYGGRAVALMSPSLPAWCFDTVVAPEHDGLSGANVIATRGVLNAMQPGEKVPGHTLVLVGGEGKHFAWDNATVCVQVASIMAHFPDAKITDSRRTPDELRQHFASEYPMQYFPWDLCAAGWLAGELARAERVWVSEDSVSMVYESLSAGCSVGLLTVAARAGRPDRLALGIAKLIDDGYVARLDIQNIPTLSHKMPVQLNEASRVATQLLYR